MLFLHSFLFFWLVFHLLVVIISRLFREEKIEKATGQKDFACVITAYKRADIALPLVDSLLKQKHDKYHIYLVGDQCDVSQIDWKDHPNASLLIPEAALNSKVKSINHAIDNMVREHEYVVIFDPDNLVPENFLSRLNDYIAKGYTAVQGLRIAKNLDSLYACLDAAGEFYYNFTTRYSPWRLGSSTNIAGSGQAVRMDLFREYLAIDEMDADKHAVIVAEDKILQEFLVSRGHRIGCMHDVNLYDEKIDGGEQLERQRTRWLNSYFEHLPKALGLFFRGLVKFDKNMALFGLFAVFPPMFLLVSTSILLGGIDLLVFLITGKTYWLYLAGILATGGFLFAFNFLLSLKLGGAPSAVMQSLWALPKFVFRQFKALFQMKQANKDFLVTDNNKSMSLEEMRKGMKD